MEEIDINFIKKHNAKKYLSDTDYIIIKIQEYEITGQAINNDYTEILQKREEARNVIRNLEQKGDE